MSDTVDKVLQSGEELRFEARPTGWPPLSPRAFAAYAVAFVLLALPELAVGAHWITLSPITGAPAFSVPFSFLAIAVGFVALLELYRLARYRSRLYVVTTERVLVLDGVHHVKARAAVAVATVRGAQLVGGEPAILTARSKFVLSGLDQVDLESIRNALGNPPLVPPRPSGLLRRRSRTVALVLAVVFVAAVEILGALQRRAHAEFVRVWTAVQGAFSTVERANPLMVSGHNGHGEFSAFFTGPEEGTCDCEKPDEGRGIMVAVICRRPFSLWPVRIRVVGYETGRAALNEKFLAELKRELEKAGIEAEWPPAPR